MVSIQSIVEQIKNDPASALSVLPMHVEQVCEQLGVPYRHRILDPATTVALFIKQIANGNSSCAQVRHLGECQFTAQAYCEARMRLPLAVLTSLSQRLSESVHQARESDPWSSSALFHGHRVFVVDGTTFWMPDTPALQAAFGQPGACKPGCGFPKAHLLTLFDLNSGMLLDTVASPMRTHDLAKVGGLHPCMQEGDVLLGDTAFGSYAHFALLL